MKTPEDEAFDELARRQGAWGGGFQAKRQAAMDKINAEFHEEYIKYRTAFPKEYTAPPQRIEENDDIQDYKRPWKKLTEEERASFEAANPKTQKEWDELFDGIEAKLKEKNFD